MHDESPTGLAAQSVDLAHVKLAAIDNGAEPQMTGIVGTLRHLADALRLMVGTREPPGVVPVDHAEIERQQAAAIALQHGEDPLAFAKVQRGEAPAEEQFAQLFPSEPEPGVPETRENPEHLTPVVGDDMGRPPG